MLQWLLISGGCFLGFLLLLLIGITRKSKQLVLIALIPLLFSLVAAAIVVFRFFWGTYEAVKQDLPQA